MRTRPPQYRLRRHTCQRPVRECASTCTRAHKHIFFAYMCACARTQTRGVHSQCEQVDVKLCAHSWMRACRRSFMCACATSLGFAGLANAHLVRLGRHSSSPSFGNVGRKRRVLNSHFAVNEASESTTCLGNERAFGGDVKFARSSGRSVGPVPYCQY